MTEAQAHRIVPLKNDMSHVTVDPTVEEGIYTPVYLGRHRFETVIDPALDKRVFVIIRDLRDTLISWYFSLKVSHGVGVGNVAAFREQLNALNFEEGLKYLICGNLVGIAKIQTSWITSTEPIIRYEDMLADEQGVYKKIFSHCGFAFSDSDREKIVQKHSFEQKSGRKRGQEDIKSHYRKAMVGDWKNHFSDPIKDLFKERFGQVLIDTGYESNFDW